MRRHLPRLLLTGALLSPVTLYALGLGEIRLNSALNQPFDAEIELLSPTPEELGSLRSRWPARTCSPAMASTARST